MNTLSDLREKFDGEIRFLHRDHFTEERWFNENGELIFSCWWLHGGSDCVQATLWKSGEKHCDTGPARWVNWLEVSGPFSPRSLEPSYISGCYYYLHGQEVPEEAFLTYRELRDDGLPEDMALAWIGIDIPTDY